MNYRLVFHVVGMILILLGLSMSFSIGWSLYYNTDLNFYHDIFALLKSLGATILFGSILFIITYKRSGKEMSIRDAFAIVSIAWVSMAIFSALPYYFSLNISYVDAFFEAMSGLTTTGASVLNDLESISHGILFWRSFTHFIGGMGIIVFSIAILPLLGFGGVQLFKAEVAGPTADKLTPRVRQTAKYLWGIYIGLIVVETLVLYIEGIFLGVDKMNFFHALCHSFGTIATAGFSTYNNSISSFNSPVILWTIIVFMFLSATNFTLHFLFIVKGSFDYLKNPEFKAYITAMLLIFTMFFINLLNHQLIEPLSLIEKFQYSNNYQVPKITKIVLNMGIGEAKEDSKILDKAQEELTLITGQKAVKTSSKKAIANFKIREGMKIGVSVTLRNKIMYEFLDRLINIALPRIRDFRGLNSKSFDGCGNFSMGIKEQIIFTEINYDKVDKIRGLDITICTSANNDEEALELLKGFNMPFPSNNN